MIRLDGSERGGRVRRWWCRRTGGHVWAKTRIEYHDHERYPILCSRCDAWFGGIE